MVRQGLYVSSIMCGPVVVGADVPRHTRHVWVQLRDRHPQQPPYQGLVVEVEPRRLLIGYFAAGDMFGSSGQVAGLERWVVRVPCLARGLDIEAAGACPVGTVGALGGGSIGQVDPSVDTVGAGAWVVRLEVGW